MLICHENNGNAPNDVQVIPTSLGNISHPKLADCIERGWLIYKKSDISNIKGSHWEVQEDSYVEVVDVVWTQEELDQQAAEQKAALDAIPFEVSKFKLCQAFAQYGTLDDFMSFIKADTQREFFWNAAMVLDSNNPLVLAAIEEIVNLLPEGISARDLLLMCRVE